MTIIPLPRHITQKLVIASSSLQDPLRRHQRLFLGGRKKLLFNPYYYRRSYPGRPEEVSVCGFNGCRGQGRSILPGGRQSCREVVELFSMEIYQKTFYSRTDCSEERQLDDPVPQQ